MPLLLSQISNESSVHQISIREKHPSSFFSSPGHTLALIFHWINIIANYRGIFIRVLTSLIFFR